MVTFIVTLSVTALITVIITSMYYKCQYELKKVKVDNDDDDLTRHLIIMHKNPAYVSSNERVKVANYTHISQETQEAN